jgi:hypothetical protein
MIEITIQTNFEDYYKAQKNHSLKRSLLITLTLAAISIYIAAVTGEYLFSGLVFAYLAIRPFFMRTRIKRTWEKTPSAHKGSKNYGLDEIGFHSTDDAGNPSVAHWDKFLKWRESKDTFFLYLSPHMYFFLPKKFIQPENHEQVRIILKSKIEPEP